MMKYLWSLWYHVTNCECHYHEVYGRVIHAGCRIHDTQLARWARRILK